MRVSCQAACGAFGSPGSYLRERRALEMRVIEPRALELDVCRIEALLDARAGRLWRQSDRKISAANRDHSVAYGILEQPQADIGLAQPNPLGRNHLWPGGTLCGDRLAPLIAQVRKLVQSKEGGTRRLWLACGPDWPMPSKYSASEQTAYRERRTSSQGFGRMDPRARAADWAETQKISAMRLRRSVQLPA
jgi:hypothetical protein